MESVYQDKDGNVRPDEDFDLFLDELKILVNKYHYGIQYVHFVKFLEEEIKVVDFYTDGKYITSLVQDHNDTPPHLII